MRDLLDFAKTGAPGRKHLRDADDQPKPLFIDRAGRFEGYASIFGEPDLSGDIVLPGAFLESLKLRQPRMLLLHDPGSVLGAWLSIKEDASGLLVAGRLDPYGPLYWRISRMLRDGTLNGLSIGFRTQMDKRISASLREIQKIDLWEISLTSSPLHPKARIFARGKNGCGND